MQNDVCRSTMMIIVQRKCSVHIAGVGLAHARPNYFEGLRALLVHYQFSVLYAQVPLSGITCTYVQIRGSISVGGHPGNLKLL